jgi:hypothetical protein
VAKWTELAGTRDYLVHISARGHQDYGIAAHANEESKCRRSIFHKASKLEYVVRGQDIQCVSDVAADNPVVTL